MSDRGCAFGILLALLIGVGLGVVGFIVVCVQLAQDVAVTIREVGPVVGAEFGRAFEMVRLLLECVAWVYKRFLHLFLWWG